MTIPQQFPSALSPPQGGASCYYRERRAITVRGIVQGVGFRPHVNRLASQLQLAGFVKNHAGAVVIEVEGSASAINQFVDKLQSQPPPLSKIDHLASQPRLVLGERRFRIEQSESDPSGQVFVSPDMATCPDCLAELFDPSDRRYRYPFLNCTNCGPRLTIVRGAPYDRERTTMAPFAMCAACQAEYDDPGDRRYHAQPIACPDCGPKLEVRNACGERIEAADPLAHFVHAVLDGQIGAVKGLGGYHLVCDARHAAAVGELRRRKHRDEKPLAVMLRDLAAAWRICVVSPLEQELLESRRRPIVLLRKRLRSEVGDNCLADAIAPGNPYLGVMLPYTPLHHLLLDAVGGHPLVMTSGNRSDEPIAYLDEDAFQRLQGIADFFLTHDRPIHVRCDDSVTRIVAGTESLVRRSRGYSPEPVELPFESATTILAVGGQLKCAFALGRGRQAFLSHHLGDLDHFEAFQAFDRDIRLCQQLFDMQPALVVHDLHPDYASTGYAQRRASEDGLQRLAVQHHHAHMASCMAENGLTGPTIGVCFDGTAFGTDGTIWGGEFLVGDYRQFRRAAHLRRVRLPGGDQATRETWRMALSHLLDAGCDDAPFRSTVSPRLLQTVRRMMERGFNSPETSSMGRLFDAVAAIAGVRQQASYEGQAAIELEWLATDASDDFHYPHCVQTNVPTTAAPPTYQIDTRSLIKAVARDGASGVSPRVIARRFHTTLVEMTADVAGRIRGDTALNDIVLSGGVFMNALLSAETSNRLATDGFRVFRHQLVPPNDGGLSLGQLAIAAAHTTCSNGAESNGLVVQKTACPNERC